MFPVIVTLGDRQFHLIETIRQIVSIFPKLFFPLFDKKFSYLLKVGSLGRQYISVVFSSNPPHSKCLNCISGCRSANAVGTKPANAGAIGSIPSSRIRFNILCCSFICSFCQPSVSGPSQPFRFPIRCHGKCAGPVKKPVYPLLSIPFSATLARQSPRSLR